MTQVGEVSSLPRPDLVGGGGRDQAGAIARCVVWSLTVDGPRIGSLVKFFLGPKRRGEEKKMEGRKFPSQEQEEADRRG